jgi:D-threo-aldose 1-dehydrogenase
VPIGAAAVRFTLRHPGVTGVVLGARSPAEITADVGYLATDAPDDLFGDLAAEGLVPEPPGLAPSS